MAVFTIGYEGLSMDDFMSLLTRHGIETIVDIRELPLSRKPGFSKRSLADALNLSGREYIHLAALGCPKAVRNQYRENGDWKQYTLGFLKYLKTQSAAIADLSDLVESSACALLCYEADYNFCHRSMVASAVNRFNGAEIVHIKSTELKKATAVVTQQLAFA